MLMRGILVLFCVCVALASVTRPADWKLVKRASPNEVHTVIFAAKPKADSQSIGDSILSEIYDETSPRYFKHLSVPEIQKIFIDFEALRKIENFIESRGLSFKTRGDFVWVTASVHTLESLLEAEFHHFEHIDSGYTIIRAKSYRIPHPISELVSLVFQTTDFPPVHQKVNRVDAPFDYGDPNVLRKTYGVPNQKLSTKITQSVLGANGGFFLEDLGAFFNMFNTPADAAVTIVTSYPWNATYCKDHDCGEPTLDLEYIMSMAPGVTTLFFNSLGDGFSESFNWLANDAGAPMVYSASLGLGAGQDYATRLCTEAQKASLRGITLFAASGDGAGFDDNCNPLNDFPVNCPYVTAVGGTQGPDRGQTEVAWTGSGAGVSPFFPTPDWQRPFLDNYIKNAPNLPAFNHSSYVYPIVAAEAAILPLIFRGSVSYAAGTSFASPIFAGIISQINVLREQKGKASLGYLNLILANLNKANQNPLNDITSGQSQGKCNKNLAAIAGWDMATGWGSPNFGKMSNYLANL